MSQKSYSNEFHTDSSIKAHGDMSKLDGRALETLNNSWLDPSFSTDLGSESSTKWDQFETNKRLFNVKSSFNEDAYTSKIDYSKLTPQMMAEAERKAREIESSTSTNMHMQEERGQRVETDGLDEEDLYSGVLRSPNTGIRKNDGASAGLMAAISGNSGKNTPGSAGTTGSPASASGDVWRRGAKLVPSAASPTTTKGGNKDRASSTSPVQSAAGSAVAGMPPPGLSGQKQSSSSATASIPDSTSTSTDPSGNTDPKKNTIAASDKDEKNKIATDGKAADSVVRLFYL